MLVSRRRMSPRAYAFFLSVLLLAINASAQRRPRNRAWTGPDALPRRATVKFEDRTKQSGIQQVRAAFKWGGPCVADVDNDGYYDLLLSFHNDGRMQLYWGSANGTFQYDSRFEHTVWDVHGVQVGPISTRTRDRLVVVSVGGRSGSDPTAPSVYRFSPDRSIREVTYQNGLGKGKGRGRTGQFMDLALQPNWRRRANGGGPDLLLLNYLGDQNSEIQGLRQFAYRNVGGNGEFKFEKVPGIGNVNRGRMEVTDVDGDGRMEVLNIRLMRMFRVKKAFEFEDISARVFGGIQFGELATAAAAELDFDNDGLWDLYIARTDRSLITNRKRLADREYESDVLLRNVGGRYVDVSREAGIPRGTRSQGVTTGDLNNDGFVDIVVIRQSEKDLVLMNQGDGTFRRRDGLIPKTAGTVGNHATAFDYDFDGRVDVMVGHGATESRPGLYRLMRNVTPRAGHYLLVRVGDAPGGAATALHAVVTVFVGDMQMSRRVGSRGAQAGGGSLLDTVHFGVGRVARVRRVRVRWTDGTLRWRVLVASDQRIEIGQFSS